MKTKTIKQKIKLVGMVPVDSGQIMIVDPCYLNDFKNNTSKAWDKGFSYAGACKATNGKNRAGEVRANKKGHGVQGVASSTGDGDGVYPVYAKYNKEGRVMGLVILFE